MKIGELAKLAGTTPRTIRLYQELGLLKPADHSKGGFRLFSEEELRKLLLINNLKMLDIPLARIVALFEARLQGNTTREAADHIVLELREKLEIINTRIDAYNKLKQEIEQIIGIYSTCPECGVLPRKEVCLRCEKLISQKELPELLEAIL
jgi:DNA-binding transcriptional MerR regulator